MFSKISSPNVLAAASSLKGESSYSHHASYELGVAVIDRFTYFNLEVLEKVESGSQSSLKDLFDTYNPGEMHSTPGIRTDLFSRPMTQVTDILFCLFIRLLRLNDVQTLITDFFGSVSSVEMTLSPYKLDDHPALLSTKSSVEASSPAHILRNESPRVLSPEEAKRAQSAKWTPGTTEIDFTFIVGCLILWFFGSAALLPDSFLKFKTDQ